MLDNKEIQAEWVRRKAQFSQVRQVGLLAFTLYCLAITMLLVAIPTLWERLHVILIPSGVFWIVAYLLVKGLVLRCPKCAHSPFSLGKQLALPFPKHHCLWCGYKLQ